MNPTILPLQCPQCGNTNNLIEKEYEFGAEFTCQQCGTKSVMVMNQQLYAPRPGDLICITCGRVSPAGTQFCQCGADLLRSCVLCEREFPLYHQICDHCGWPQTVAPTSQAGTILKVQRHLTALTDSSSAVRQTAQQALDEFFAPPAYLTPTLIKGIEIYPQNELVQRACTKLLAQIHPTPTEEILSIFDHLTDFMATEQTCFALSRSQTHIENIQSRLVELLKKSPIHWAAYETLVHLNTERSLRVEILVDILNRTYDPQHRATACQHLGELGTDAAPAIPILLETIRYDNAARIPALIALSKAGAAHKTLIDALMEGYQQDSSDQERKNIIQALAEIGDSAVPVLIFLIERETAPAMEKEICHALARIGTGAVPALVNVLKYKQNTPDVHVSACFALGLMKAKAAPAVSTLIELLNTAPPDRQLIYTYALGEIGNEQAVNPLMQMLKQREKYAPHYLHVWEAAQQALIKIGEPAAPALRELSNSLFQSKPEREAARHALNLIEKNIG